MFLIFGKEKFWIRVAGEKSKYIHGNWVKTKKKITDLKKHKKIKEKLKENLKKIIKINKRIKSLKKFVEIFQKFVLAKQNS